MSFLLRTDCVCVHLLIHHSTFGQCVCVCVCVRVRASSHSSLHLWPVCVFVCVCVCVHLLIHRSTFGLCVYVCVHLLIHHCTSGHIPHLTLQVQPYY